MKRRLTVATECAIVAAVMASTVAAVHILRAGPMTKLTILLILGVPCVAAVVLGVVTTIVPALFPDDRLSFPANITIPIIYTAILILCLKLLTTMPYGLSAPVEALTPLQFWFAPAQLALCAFGQIVVLTCLSIIRRPTPTA